MHVLSLFAPDLPDISMHAAATPVAGATP